MIDPLDDKNPLPIVVESEKQLTKTWVANTYIQAATSDNTRKAYRSDIRHYENWGGRLPATPALIVRYLEDFATLLNPRTLSRRLTALKTWHIYQNFSDPTSHPMVTKTMIGIMRTHGKPKEKAHPLTPNDIKTLANHLNANGSLSAIRDNALLQIGFFGALRRSELVALCVDHIQWEKEGITIMIPHSKTDQIHEGQYCAIPYGNQHVCPIEALTSWLTRAAIQTGPIFRRIYNNGRIEERSLTPLSVNHILRERAREVGLACAEDLSSHSLRRGLATSAARAGAPLQTIMRHGRWRQVNTVIEYIEASERFAENAAKCVLSNEID